jgi:hypothetical protein
MATQNVKDFTPINSINLINDSILFVQNGELVRLNGSNVNISGINEITSKNINVTGSFSSINRPFVNGSGVLLQGELDLSVYATVTNLATTGSTLTNNLAMTGSTLSTNIETTGTALQGQINTINNSIPNFIIAGGNARGANISIGTNDNYNFRFKTDNVARMTILSGGKVGIGTTLAETEAANPSGGLIVKESIKTFNHGDSSQWSYAYNQLTGLNLSPVTVGVPNNVTVTNGNFSNTAGMNFNGVDWYGGNVPGWVGPTDSTFAVYFNGTYYNNLNAGPKGSGANALRQQVTTSLPVVSNIALRFENANVPAVGGFFTINAAIYTTGFQVLASGSFAQIGQNQLVANNVPSGTNCIIAFWGSPQGALTNVSVTQTGIYNTLKFNNELPNSSGGLPDNSLWVDTNGFLRVV